MTHQIEFNPALKVFSELYVGFQTSQKAVPLAFATPYDTTKAGEKRRKTVDNWCRSSQFDQKESKWVYTSGETKIVKNVPRAGFKITDDVKRVYWGGGNIVWRLYDPLGWEIEIQSQNLMALLQSVGINPGGEVPGECVIGRDGAHNVLLPVSTDEYKNSIKDAASAKAPGKVPMKDRVIGRMYRLKSGEYGRYMGKMYIRVQTNDLGHYNSNPCGALEFITPENKILYAAMTQQIRTVLNDAKMEQFEVVHIPREKKVHENGYELETGGFSNLYKSAPLLMELDQEELTKDEAESIVNSHRLEFVSSTHTTKPVYASFDPELQVLEAPVPASKEVIEKAKTRAMDTARQFFSNWEAQSEEHRKKYRRKEFTVGEMVGRYETELLFRHDSGDLFGRSHIVDPNTERNQAYHYTFQQTDARTIDISGPVMFVGNSVITNERVRQLQHVTQRAPNHVLSAHVFKNADSIQELEAMIDECIAQNRFVSLKFKKVSS